MTVIAFDGRFLAADRQCSSNGKKIKIHKLYRVPQGVAAIIDDAQHGLAIVNWLQSGAFDTEFPKDESDDHANVLLIDQQKRLFLIMNKYPYPMEIFDKKYTDGSGGDIALGAMTAGKTAIDAVKLACKLDNSCGCGYSVADVLSGVIKHYN